VEFERLAAGRRVQSVALLFLIAGRSGGQPRRLVRRYGIVVLKPAFGIAGHIQSIE